MGEVTEARITPVMALVTEGQLAALKLFIGRTKAVDPLLTELPQGGAAILARVPVNRATQNWVRNERT
jgi:hypothetical protein